MDPFENQLKALPWRKAPDGLKGRLFESAFSDSSKVVHPWFIPLAWAAAVVLSVGLLVYGLVRDPRQDAATWTVLVPTDETQGFFDLSGESEDAWAGTLSLVVETN